MYAETIASGADGKECYSTFRKGKLRLCLHIRVGSLSFIIPMPYNISVAMGLACDYLVRFCFNGLTQVSGALKYAMEMIYVCGQWKRWVEFSMLRN